VRYPDGKGPKQRSVEDGSDISRDPFRGEASASIPDNGEADPSAVLRCPMLPKEDPLPSTQITARPMDRNTDRGSSQNGSHMSGHVVRAFLGMLEDGISVLDKARDKALQVSAHLWVRVLVDKQRSARVVDEDIAETLEDTALGHGNLHLAADIREAPSTGLNGKTALVDHADLLFR
jgi:hypothetical protein